MASSSSIELEDLRKSPSNLNAIQRTIFTGPRRHENRQFKYCKNEIKTSKYNVFTFLPLNLFEQFHRFANIYFLTLVILQAIPVISSVTPIITLIPLCIVLGMTASKDLVEDIHRHKSDRKINNRKTLVLHPGSTGEKELAWSQLEVGQIVLLRNDHQVPADVLILSTSDSNGLCFVETADLDGETNLKVRQALPDIQKLADNDRELANLDVIIECEAPNNNLNRFEGRLEWENKTYSLNNDNLLLRGCVLRNTAWVHGVVIFAGRDTKLIQNSGKAKMKKTRIDRLSNKLILIIMGFLGVMLIVAAINSFFFETKVGLPFNNYRYKVGHGKPIITAALNIFSFLIVIQTLIPISLYVSIEIIRVVLSRTYINSDLEMYYEPFDTPACARTTTLNEELGQIEYVFTDKTGTLTQNIMTFNKCSIAGQIYGDARPERSNLLTVDQGTDPKLVDFSKYNSEYADNKFKFYDWSLLEEIHHRGNPDVIEFFTLLALCHTVIAETESGTLEYKAQSPDEAALVAAARNFGFVYKSRSPESITISVLGKDVTYDLLCVLDFDNIRKRMSVIVQNQETGRRQLLCKGADSMIIELLDPDGDHALLQRTEAHLSEFAGSGLRTLCCAVRDVDDDTWEQWKAEYHEASTSLENREICITECYNRIEWCLRLIGATAVEDKLQAGVPETISNLAKAGIKIWVLTGDKQETAINIGYSCKMLDETMEEIIIDAEDEEDVWRQLQSAHLKQKNLMAQKEFAGVDFGLIISGNSLMHALSEELEELFMDVANECKTVICCRVTPLQKALVITLVKKFKHTVTLAIGDGANDVNMIKTAHIGVGISGQEGMQAVLNSDFSFAQFRYLQRLLLVHGRWAYLRIAVFLRYFFYKNFAFTLCHFWFAIYSGWSAFSLFDAWFIMCYNIIYTVSPIICYGWFEQDVNSYYSQVFPQLYQPGLRNAFFNLPLFLLACCEGIYDSVITFFIIRYGFADYNLPDGSNIISSHAALGVAVGTTVVIVVTIRCLLEMSYITVWSFVSIVVLSIGMVFALQIGFSELMAAVKYQFYYYGIDYPVWSSPNFWLCMVVILFLACMPLIMFRTVHQIYNMTLTSRVRLKQLAEGKKADDYQQLSGEKVKSSSLRRSRRHGSSYAFSQQPGMGDLIQRGILREGSQIHRSHPNRGQFLQADP